MGALAVAPRPGLPADLPTDLPTSSDRAISSGFLALDAILGLGGLPREATTSLHGDGTSGKTTLALQAVAQAQAAGGIVAYLDMARSLDPVEAVARGVQLDWLVVLTPSSLEEALAMAAMLLQDRTVDLLILDMPLRPLEGASISAASLAERLGRLAALARRAGVQLVVLEPPSLPAALAGALSQVSALRLELSRQAWIRLGRDVVGQRTEVRVVRDRFAPPGRAAELRILYAEGGLRDACLAREELLRDGSAGPGLTSVTGRDRRAGAPPGGFRPSPLRPSVRPSPTLHSTAKSVFDDETPPSLLAPSSSSTGSQQVLRAIRGGASHPGRPSMDGRAGAGREPAGIGAGSPARDAARGGP
jgi:RecA/RadA recombinase